MLQSHGAAYERGAMTLESHPIAVGITSLQHGDHVLVLAQSGHIVIRGEIDDVAPRHHLVWIRDELLGERKIIMDGEDEIRLVTKPNSLPAAPGAMPPSLPLPRPVERNDHN